MFPRFPASLASATPKVLVRKLSGALVAELLMEKMQLVVALKDPQNAGSFRMVSWKELFRYV